LNFFSRFFVYKLFVSLKKKVNTSLLLDYGDEILLIENQPSIRILMEWIFIKTYVKIKEEDNLWKKLDDVCELEFFYQF
jgi:hypothetical protein